MPGIIRAQPRARQGWRLPSGDILGAPVIEARAKAGGSRLAIFWARPSSRPAPRLAAPVWRYSGRAR